MYKIGLCKGCKARQEKLAAVAKVVINNVPAWAKRKRK